MGGPMPSLVSGNSSSTAAAQQVRGRMAIDFQRLGIFGRQYLEGGVVIERAVKVVHLSVDTCDYGVVGEAWTDRLGDPQRFCA